jgi:DNA topoisomerase-1
MAQNQSKPTEDKPAEACDKCGSAMVSKSGRYGPFLACSRYPDCKSTRPVAGGDDALALPVHEDVRKAVCPKDGKAMVARNGRYGPFLACARYPDCRETQRLVRGDDGLLQVEVLAPLEEKCPECSQALVRRHGRFGAFVACSNYPACRYIKKKDDTDIGLLCPECNQGQILERKGRWGRPFYGCRRYPECRFTAYHRPIPEPCPECARPYLLEKETKKEGKVVFCGNEECHFKRQAA